jgi:hypothetical protein
VTGKARPIPKPAAPLDWLKQRLKRDESSPTGFVWRKRPRSDFVDDATFKSWHSTNLDRPAGVTRALRGKITGHVLIKYEGANVYLDTRALMIAFKTGAWPTGVMEPWPDADVIRHGSKPWAADRLRVGKGYLGQGVLARYFASECASFEPPYPPNEITVLSKQSDPFRLDTPSLRRNGEWFTEHFTRLIVDDVAHLRGVHYVFSGASIRKPDGDLYRNTFADWRWLILRAAKPARWLGLVPWERIVDNRNEAPRILRVERAVHAHAAILSIEMQTPQELDVSPEATLENFAADQPFCIAFFREKSAVDTILVPLAERYRMNLYPSSGDMVDRSVWEIARDARRDGRKLIVFTVCDCDPGGHNMPIAIARKLQAYAISTFPGLKFEVVRAGLTVDQAGSLGLPSAPLKPSEARADRWRDAMGVGQIELDAAMALRRTEFAQMIEAAIEPYFDETLSRRTDAAREAWEETAQSAIDNQLDANEIVELQDRYDNARAEIGAVSYRPDEIAEGLALPAPPEPPQPNMDGKEERRRPLIDSARGFVEGSLKLKVDKAYESDDDDDVES